MAIELQGIRKSYKGLPVLDGLDLRAGEGEVTALLGPSGCGKTTLLEIISGTLVPDSGEVRGIDGRKVGYVFQEQRLLPWLTVAGNIEFVLRDLFANEEVRRRSTHWIELVGLAEFRDHYPRQLSGGMRQRVGIARAFAYPSELLLLDEPFQALDLRLKLDLIAVFDELWRNDRRTTLFVTHDVNEALLLADRIYLMSLRPSRIQEGLTVDLAHGSRSLTDPALGEIARRLYALLTVGPDDRPQPD